MLTDTIDAATIPEHFSNLMRRVRAGEEITLTDRGMPIAKIIPTTIFNLPLDSGNCYNVALSEGGMGMMENAPTDLSTNPKF